MAAILEKLGVYLLIPAKASEFANPFNFRKSLNRKAFS